MVTGFKNKYLQNKTGVKSVLANEQGIITIQFLFVMVVCFVFILSFFGLTLTLFNGSAVQYLTYSSARKMLLAGQQKQEQITSSQSHYEILKKQMFNNKMDSSGGWFNISNSKWGFNPGYQESDANYRKLFFGSYLTYNSQLANFKIPFLTDEQGGELSTIIGSYLGREPSQQECRDFNNARQEKLCKLYGKNCTGETPGDNAC